METFTETISYLDDVRNFEDARKLFPVTESCIYLDSAHYSQFSLETRKRLMLFIDEYTFTNKNLSEFNNSKSDSLKDICAKLIGASKNDIIITGSTTHGLNIFVNGIQLKKGDCVACADSEFPAIVYPWLYQEKIKDIKTILISSTNGQINIEDIEKTIRENKVKVLTISSVGFLGFRNDLKAISRICKDNNCYLVVDGIQGTGVCPINVTEFEIDFFSAGSQKWMMAPAGVGFAFISPRIKEKVIPTYIATSSFDYDFKNFLDYKLNFRKDGGAYENSTPNTLGMIGMESSIELFLKLGVENIFNHILKLQDIFIENIKGTEYVIVSNQQTVHRSNILIFTHKDKSKNELIQSNLEKENIFIALREGFLRLSAHLFNNEEEIMELVNVLKEIEN